MLWGTGARAVQAIGSVLVCFLDYYPVPGAGWVWNATAHSLSKPVDM